MNVSEYKLIVSLVNKVKEPVIAIEIAKDALTLGRKIDTLKKNISYLQKNISNDQNFIKDMAAQWRDRFDEDMDLIQTKIYLELKIVRNKQKIQDYMEEYDFIMDKPYNIDYLINKIIGNSIKDGLENQKYDKLQKFFNENEEQQEDLIITTIRELLNESGKVRTKIKKFEITTCIMCVISNSPIYINKYTKFKNAILVLVDELESEINTLGYDFSTNKIQYYNYIQKIKLF